MPQRAPTGDLIRFSGYEVDLRQRLVRFNGVPVAIQDKPLQFLLALLERPGELVSREELRVRLWPTDAFGVFEDGLNTAVRKLRISLNDSVESPRFIATIPRRGYRFIGEVEILASPMAGVEELALPASVTTRRSFLWGAVSILVVLAVATFFVIRARQQASPAHNIRSIAVLPFTNLSGDPSQEYFADAMTDEMTSDLAKIGALRVISRTSAMHYKGTARTMPEIARELKVDGVIEGSVVRTVSRVRITVQLIDARSDVHIWSDSYERDLNDVLALQNELAHTIATQVRAAISPAEESLMRPQPVQPAAYEAYLLGRSQLEKWTISGATEGLHYFQHAIQIDDQFALAYVGVAECYSSFMGVDGVGYREGLDRANDALNLAIALKPDMGEAHAMLGSVRMQRDWDFPAAEAEMRKGLALSPGYAAGHHWYSHLLMYLGRFDESMVEARKTLELDPLSPAANLHMGYEYRALREWDRAIEQQKKTLELDPGYVDAHADLGEDYLGKGMYPEAIAELRQAAELVHSDPDYPFYAATLGFALAKSGNTAEARRILGKIGDRPDFASFVYAGLGDREKSIALLNEAFRRHTVPLDAGFILELDPLRSDPRFNYLLHRVGLR